MPTAFYSHPDCRGHDMGAGHPECALRLDAINDFLLASGLDVALQRREATKVELNNKIESTKVELNNKIDIAVSDLGGRINALDARMTMMQWMLGLVIALCLGILWKLLR